MPSVTVNVTFKRDKTISVVPGSSLWFVMKDVTNQQVKKLFNNGLAGEDKEKYSRRIHIRSSLTGNVYSLYKSYGVWRVGATNTHAADEAAIKALFNVTEAV